MENLILAFILLGFPILIVFLLLYRMGYFKKIKELQDPTPEIKNEWYPGIHYQELFNYMSEEHGLTLLQSDMDEIIHISGRFLDKNPVQNITRKF